MEPSWDYKKTELENHSQVAKNILQAGMVDGEGLIKPVERWGKSIGKYIKPIKLKELMLACGIPHDN